MCSSGVAPDISPRIVWMLPWSCVTRRPDQAGMTPSPAPPNVSIMVLACGSRLRVVSYQPHRCMILVFRAMAPPEVCTPLMLWNLALTELSSGVTTRLVVGQSPGQVVAEPGPVVVRVRSLDRMPAQVRVVRVVRREGIGIDAFGGVGLVPARVAIEGESPGRRPAWRGRCRRSGHRGRTASSRRAGWRWSW